MSSLGAGLAPSEAVDAGAASGFAAAETVPPIGLTVLPGLDCSILSTLLAGHDSVEVPYEHPLLRFFTMREATQLRTVHPELFAAVSATRFVHDSDVFWKRSGRAENSVDISWQREYYAGKTDVRPLLGRQFPLWRICFPSAEMLWVGSPEALHDILVAARAGDLATIRVLVVGVSFRMVEEEIDAERSFIDALPCFASLEACQLRFGRSLQSDNRTARALVAALGDNIAVTSRTLRCVCCALGEMSSYVASGVVEAVAGALPVLIAAFRTHFLDIVSCRHVCRLLVNLRVRPGALLDAGGIPVLIAALHTHASDQIVADYVSCTVGSLAVDCFCSISKKHCSSCSALVATGALPALFEVLRLQAGSEIVCTNAIAALENISRCYIPPTQSADKDVPALVAALRTHVSNIKLCSAASKAIVNIARNSLAGFEACEHAGAVPALVATIRTHLLSDFPSVCAINALAIIALSPRGRDACISAGAIPCCVSFLEALPKWLRESNCGSAALALMNFAMSSLGQEECVASGAVAALVAACDTKNTNFRILAFVCGALSNISLHPVGKTACIAAGAVTFLTNALNDASGRHLYNYEETLARLYQHASNALHSIALSTAGKSACAESGADLALVTTLCPARNHDGSRARNHDGLSVKAAARALCTIVSLPAQKDAFEARGAASDCDALSSEVFDAHGNLSTSSVSFTSEDDKALTLICAVRAIVAVFDAKVSRELVNEAVTPGSTMPQEHVTSWLEWWSKPKPLSTACRISGALTEIASCFSSAGQNALVVAGALPVLVALVRSTCSSSRPRAISHACDALQEIVSSPLHAAACITAGVIPCLVAALRSLPDKTGDIARTLLTLARRDEGIDAGVSDDAVLPIIEALRKIGYYGYENVCTVPGILAEFFLHFPSCRVKCAAAAAAAIVFVLRSNEGFSDRDHVLGASRMAWNLALSPEGKDACAACGAASALIESFRSSRKGFGKCKWVPPALQNASGALCAIALSPSDKEDAVSAGTVPFVIELMAQQATADAADFERTSDALNNVATVPSGRIAALPAVPILVAAVARFGADACPSSIALLSALGFSNTGAPLHPDV